MLGDLLKKIVGKTSETNEAIKLINASKDLSRRQKYKLVKEVTTKGLKRALARGTTIAAVAASDADARKEAAKANAQSYQRALDIYQSLINQNPTPAEGTGEPSAGNNGSETTGSATTGAYPGSNH